MLTFSNDTGSCSATGNSEHITPYECAGKERKIITPLKVPVLQEKVVAVVIMTSNPHPDIPSCEQKQERRPQQISLSSGVATTHTVSPLECMDLLRRIISFIGCHQYRFVAIINQRFKNVYLQSFPNDKTTYCNAPTLNHATICLQEMANHRIDFQCRLCRSAARNGSISVLQYLRSVHCSWDSSTCTVASQHGHLSVLQWARANGCPWDEWTCMRAAQNGHLTILQWARANGCPWDEWTSGSAAENGHSSILEWARANDCPWDSSTCALAAANGHLTILQWARANGCPWDSNTCLLAAENGHLTILQWALGDGCPWDRDETCDIADRYRRTNVVEWIENNHPM